MAEQNNPSNIVAQAQALINEVQRQLAQVDDFYRSQGLDPHKVRVVLKAQSTPQVEAEARSAFDADMQLVEQEAREEQARLSFNTGTGTAGAPSAKRPRMMI